MGLGDGVRRCEAVGAWSEVVGDKIAEATEARGIYDGVLQVACRSNVWANEMTLLKPKLLRALQKAVGKDVVKDMRFFAERLPKRKPLDVVAEGGERGGVRDPAAIAQAEAAAEAAAGLVKDADLSDKIKRAVRTAMLAEAEKIALGWRKCESCGAMHNERGGLCAVCRIG